MEETLETREIFKGKILDVKELKVALPNGRASTREVVYHPGAVAVLVQPDENTVVLVRQYRKACEQNLWELPAGKLEPLEDPSSAAMRELREETGFNAREVKKLYEFYTAPGFTNEKIHLYRAVEVTEGEPDPDEDEFVETRVFTKDECQSLMQDGQIVDAKTLVALLWWVANPTL